MTSSKHLTLIMLIGVGLTLIAAGLSPFLIADVARAQDAPPTDVTTPDAPLGVPTDTAVDLGASNLSSEVTLPSGVEVTGSNSYCLVCHNQPWKSITFEDGSIQNLYVDPDTVAASVHGADSSTGTLGCVDCHGADAFPHNQPTPTDGREYTLGSVTICATCHEDAVQDLEMGLHEEAIRAGNREAAVCTDCHGAHDVRPIVEQPDLIAGVCGECHETTLVEWQGSAHVDIEPLGCVTCHSQHSQRLRVGATPDELCMNCHKQDEVETIFVHNQHLPSEADVTCVDCHMYTGEHDGAQAVPISTAPLSTGHSMLMDPTPCNTCHEALVASGEWAQLVADREVVASVPETVETLPIPEAVATEEAAAGVGSIQLFQGLILGLGFGVTFAAVFIARGNRAQRMGTPQPPPPSAPAEVSTEHARPDTPDELSMQDKDNPDG